MRASGLVRHCRVASSVASGQYTGLGHPQRRFRGSLVGERIRAGRELEGRPGSRCASTGAKYRAQIEHAGRGLVVVTGRPPVSGSDGDPPSGLVTLLFTNIEGSTRLLRRVGDHYNDLLERHRQIIRDASVAEGGFEIGHEGDSARIVFQTASDGITAALAAQRALHDESWPTGCAVRVRMGLHTGPVAYASGQYAGITVHDAARVANAARGGQIVCSETTADCTTLPAGTSLRSLGLHRLTDPAVEMTLFQICHGDLPLSFPTLRSMAPTSGIVVGRDRELGRLDGLLGAAHAGSGTLLVIAGEPGIGKSTLLVELARRSAGMGMPVLAGRAVLDDGSPAFWPWLTALDHGPGLGLSGALLDRGAGPPDQMLFLAMERTVRALVAAAVPAGLVVTLEDLHWADPSALRLLRLLVGELPTSRLLVAATARTVSGTLAGLPRETLELAPLTAADISAYLAAVAGGAVHESWPDCLERHTGGNPLFLHESVRVLIEEGRLGGEPMSGDLLKEALRIGGDRFDALTGACRAALGLASAIGEDFDVALVASILDRDTDDLMAEALSAGVVVEDPAEPRRLRFSHALMCRARYDQLSRAQRIRLHARIADALARAGPGVPAEIARHRVRAAVDLESSAEALAACRSAAAAAIRAVDPVGAVYWYRSAADLAASSGLGDAERAELLASLAEAAYQAGQIDDALRHCVAAAEHAVVGHRPELVARAAVTVRGIGGAEPNRIIVGLCERAAALLGAGHDSLRAQVLAQQTMAMIETKAMADAAELSASAMLVAERSGDPVALVDALHARHKVAAMPEHVAEQLELSIRLQSLGSVPARPDAALWAHIWRIDAAMQTGAIGEVDAEIRGLADLVARLRWSVARWHLLRIRTVRSVLSGDFATAAVFWDEANAICQATQDKSGEVALRALALDIERKTGRFRDNLSELAADALAGGVPLVLAGRANYLYAAGRPDDAATLLDRLRPTLTTLPRDLAWWPTVRDIGEVSAALGDTEVARLCYDNLLPYSGYYLGSVAGYRGAVPYVLGLMAAALGEPDSADRYLTGAETMEHRVGAVADLAIARLAHARVLSARGSAKDRRRAAELAEQSALTAKRLGMAPTLQAATRLSDELAGVGAGAALSLTPREKQVAALIARGYANRAIAEQYVLSERTVETHVRNLLTKLGLTNRTQIAGWAVRNEIRG